jgi:hypothetical protein
MAQRARAIFTRGMNVRHPLAGEDLQVRAPPATIPIRNAAGTLGGVGKFGKAMQTGATGGTAMAVELDGHSAITQC